jgi:NADPH-dependent F420 reductase
MTIAVLGGTGALGSGLVKRLAKAGRPVIIGSRDAQKAQAAASEYGEGVAGTDYASAAAQAGIIILTIPFAAHDEVLEAVKTGAEGKVFIDATAPLAPPRVWSVQLPPEGSAAQRTQAILGEGVKVVSAFQNVGARHLHEDHEIDCDVLVCGNDAEAVATTLEIVETVGLRGVRAGPLANAAAAEALTSVLIQINRTYKVPEAGIRITGLPQS